MLAPKAQLNKPRLALVEPRKPLATAPRENLVWAISYADLLMVLISFFIIFFSFDKKEERDQVLNRIAIGMQGIKAGSGSDTVAEVGPHETQELRAASEDLKGRVDQWSRELDQAQIKVRKQDEYLVADFPDAAYESGEYRVPENLKNDLKTLAAVLKPYVGEVQLVVIGHADQRPLRKRNEFLVDNFDLSTLRATQALRFLSTQGISLKYLFAQGASDNDRNQRSLSIEIRENRRKERSGLSEVENVQ